MIDIEISNLGLAITSLLGMFSVALFLAKGVIIGIDAFVENMK